MRPSICRFSFFAVGLIATSSTLFATSCLDLQVQSDPAGAGGNGSSSSGDMSSSSADVSSSSTSSGNSSSSSSSSGMSGGFCGDGLIDMGEQCDDANAISGDGCSSTCQIEGASNCSAEMVTIGKGQKIELAGSTVGASDTFKGTVGGTPGNCTNGSWTGPDAIYRIEPKDNGNLTVTTDVKYTNSLVHTRSQCPGAPADQLACGYRTNEGIITWTLPVSQDAVYYVAVDAFTSSGGPYTVTFALE